MDLKSISRDKFYIPEFNGNKSQEKKIKINYSRFVSAGQMRKYKAFKSNLNGEIEVVYKDEELLINHIKDIENLSLDGSPIDTAEKLLNAEDLRLYDLIVEIRNDLMKDAEPLEEGES